MPPATNMTLVEINMQKLVHESTYKQFQGWV